MPPRLTYLGPEVEQAVERIMAELHNWDADVLDAEDISEAEDSADDETAPQTL